MRFMLLNEKVGFYATMKTGHVRTGGGEAQMVGSKKRQVRARKRWIL